ncbi:MAG: polyprenyl synthetase family protein [Tannerella sp.]|nr:polyprenyl synthetase family protein [Tannerella sp.]
MLSFEEILRTIEESIRQLRFDFKPEGLFEPIEYTLSLGGKRIRPAFMLMACNLYSEKVDAALKPALGIEVFHNFTLLHDDLMDEADKRRNQATVHKKWGRNVAILSGDAMLIAAYQLVGETKEPYLKKILDLFSQTALDICRGQQYDMEFESRSDVTEEDYLEMIRLKTAVLLACSLKCGAIIGNASEEDADTLYRFGLHIGLAFQLQDDMLDVYGDSQTFGKNIGGDIVCDKKTFLLIQALKQASDQQKAVIRRYQQAEGFGPEEKISAITSVYNELNVKETVQDRIRYYAGQAMHELSLLQVPSERTVVLRDVSLRLMERES